MPAWLKSLLDLFSPSRPEPGPLPAGKMRTLEYAPGLKLDFASAGSGLRPLVILIHGGGWMHGTRANMRPYGPALLGAGYHVASIDYRLAPANKWPAQREDAVKAWEYLNGRTATLGIDPGRIAVLGKSSGAQIGAMLALTTYARIRCLSLVSGPLYLGEKPLAQMTSKQRQALEAEFGPSPSPKVLADASPVSFVTSSTPPTLLIHGQADPLVPYSQSVAMQRALDVAGVPNELHLLRGEDHQFTATAQQQERNWLVSWFRVHL